MDQNDYDSFMTFLLVFTERFLIFLQDFAIIA